MASEPDPPWLREAARAFAHELVGWWRTLVAVTLAPRRFAAGWATGEIHALNPLAFSLNTLAIAGPLSLVIVHLNGGDDDVLPLWAQVLKPLFPWMYNLLWIAPVHLALRALGGTRRLRTTAGVSFYASGPVHVLRLAALPFQLRAIAYPHDVHVALASGIVGLVVAVVFSTYLTAAFAGAHRIRAWRAALVVVFFFVASAILWAWFGVKTGTLGLRVVRALIT